MSEERRDPVCVEVVEPEPGGCLSGLLVQESQQQPEAVTVGRDRVWAGRALMGQAIDEERLQERRERGHERCDRTIITHLTKPEIKALLTAPDTNTWIGRRDHTMIQLDIETGLRVSELTALTIADTHLGTGAHVACHGKGRKDRINPLTKHTARLLRAWLRERAGEPADPVFPTSTDRPLTRDAVARRLTIHARNASLTCTTLHNKNITPHVLRHTAAMRLLHAGIDTSVIALWLGHESIETTRIYLDADLDLKERALARTTPASCKPGRYKPSDALIAFLEGL